MTSINAMKFNRNQGACMSDEERGWNDEGLVSLTTEKMRIVTDEEIVSEQRTAAIYGNTGTSTVGEELRTTIKRRISELYRKEKDKAGKPPASFMPVEAIAREAFDVITRMKHAHTDWELEGRYGFKTSDFVRGFYEKGGEKIDIKDPEIVKTVDELLTWKGRSSAPQALHLNAGIVAGYDPRNGFSIFGVSMITPYVEPVQEIFLADGSGRDMTTVVFTEDLNRRTLAQRRGDIDPVEGLMTMFDALNSACRHDIGVGGYPCIIMIDGSRKNPSEIACRIQDHRGKLGAEICAAESAGFVSADAAAGLVQRLFFDREAFETVEQDFLGAAKNPKGLLRMLRGYN